MDTIIEALCKGTKLNATLGEMAGGLLSIVIHSICKIIHCLALYFAYIKIH